MTCSTSSCKCRESEGQVFDFSPESSACPADSQTQIARKSIGRAEENVRISREHYQEGLTTMTVLLDAQRQQQQALTQYNAAVSEYLQAKTKYLILTGRRRSAK